MAYSLLSHAASGNPRYQSGAARLMDAIAEIAIEHRDDDSFFAYLRGVDRCASGQIGGLLAVGYVLVEKGIALGNLETTSFAQWRAALASAE